MNTKNKASYKSITRLVKGLELNLYLLLEAANKAFNEALKPSQVNTEARISFTSCQEKYTKIMTLILHNRQNNITSDVLESYYLESCLGKLQSEQNDLPQNPYNEEVVLNNDRKLEEIKKSLDLLYLEANKLNKKLRETKRSGRHFLLDYEDLLSHIESYFTSWDTTVNERKAIYYYNFSLKLLEKADNVKDNTQHGVYLLNNAIKYLTLSCEFYNSIEQFENEKETRQFKKKIEKRLKNLKESIQNKKRKQVTIFIPDTSSSSSTPVKRAKIAYHANSSNSVLPTPEEEIEQIKKEHIEKTLNELPDDPSRYTLYSKLFFTLANRLSTYSKESSNHTLLTKLSWLTIANNLMLLSPNKNESFREQISQLIHQLSEKNKKTLHTISSQKRAQAYPIYSELELQSKDLKDLLILEALDYHYGLEAFQLHYAGINFLDSVPPLIESQYAPYFAEKNTLNQIKSSIHSVHANSENLFCAHLLRELVKFYICSENKMWLQNTFSLKNETLFYGEYYKLLATARHFSQVSGPEGINFISKIRLLEKHLSEQTKDNKSVDSLENPSSHTTFFSSPTKALLPSMALFIKILKEHLRYLVNAQQSDTGPSTIYENILKLIKNQCNLYKKTTHALSTGPAFF